MIIDNNNEIFFVLPMDEMVLFPEVRANSLSTIPAPLLDRTEIIQISSYTEREKFAIGRDYLIPEILEDHGITTDQLQIEDDAIRGIIEEYTREAGVRGLKKQLAKIARVASEKIVSGKESLPFVLVETVEEVLKETLGLDLPGPSVLFSQLGTSPSAPIT